MAQFNSANGSYQTHNKTLFEVNQIATSNGAVVSNTNRFPVTLGSENITITGNVNVSSVVAVNSSPSDPVHTHITEVGNSGILSVPYLPIGGTVTVSAETPELYAFNNFGVFTHRGWTMSDDLIPMLSVRAKSTATKTVKLLEYELGNNNANQSTIGYVWLEDATITGTQPSWTSLNTEAEYRFYTDAYGSNTPNGFTGGTQRHAGIIIGKNASAEEELRDIPLVASGKTLTLCVMRMDSSTKLDLWFAATMGVYI
jgi:hypothetical protein